MGWMSMRCIQKKKVFVFPNGYRDSSSPDPPSMCTRRTCLIVLGIVVIGIFILLMFTSLLYHIMSVNMLLFRHQHIVQHVERDLPLVHCALELLSHERSQQERALRVPLSSEERMLMHDYEEEMGKRTPTINECMVEHYAKRANITKEVELNARLMREMTRIVQELVHQSADVNDLWYEAFAEEYKTMRNQAYSMEL